MKGPHRDTLGLSLYRRLTGVGGPFANFLLRRRMVQGKEDPDRIGERRGIASLPRPDGPLIWLHCASVGESLSVLPLIEQLSVERSDLHFLVTTGTLTSAQLMADRLPPHAIHQFIPLDHPAYCARFFAHWQPDLGVMIESELWPNLILGANERHIPMVLANARFSEGSFNGWRRAPKSIARLLGAFEMVLAQEEKTAMRLRRLGAAHVSVPGNLKDDALPLPINENDLNALQQQRSARPCWLAASTHEGEEALVARVHERVKRDIPDLLTIVAPRHPVRGSAIASDLRKLGLTVAQRSKGELLAPDTAIYLADTLGEMGLFFRLAPIAFLGGSFIDVGGHNPMEAARLNSAILFGPSMYNFDASVETLTEAGAALQTMTEDDLTTAVHHLLTDQVVASEQARKGMEVAAKSSGTAKRMSALLVPLLPPRTAISPPIQRAT